MINMKEKKNIRVLDDIYWKDIIYELKFLLPNYNFPIYENVESPIPYLSSIHDWDIIVLDNFFFYEGREQAIWDDFLRQYLKLKRNCKIICISNFWEKILTRFPMWQKTYSKWDILWFVPSKRADDIAFLILNSEKQN